MNTKQKHTYIFQLIFNNVVVSMGKEWPFQHNCKTKNVPMRMEKGNNLDP